MQRVRPADGGRGWCCWLQLYRALRLEAQAALMVPAELAVQRRLQVPGLPLRLVAEHGNGLAVRVVQRPLQACATAAGGQTMPQPSDS